MGSAEAQASSASRNGGSAGHLAAKAAWVNPARLSDRSAAHSAPDPDHPPPACGTTRAEAPGLGPMPKQNLDPLPDPARLCPHWAVGDLLARGIRRLDDARRRGISPPHPPACLDLQAGLSVTVPAAGEPRMKEAQ